MGLGTRGAVGLAALGAVLGGGAGVAYAEATPPTWTATAYVIAAPAAGSATEAVPVEIAQAYGRVVDQPQVVGRAADALDEPVTEVDAAVQGVTSPESPLVELTAAAGSPELAADRANAVAEALVAFGATQARGTGVELSVFSAAEPPAAPSSAGPVLAGAVGAAAGVLVGGLAVLAGADRRRRDRPSPLPDGPPAPAAVPVGDHAGFADADLFSATGARGGAR